MSPTRLLAQAALMALVVLTGFARAEGEKDKKIAPTDTLPPDAIIVISDSTAKVLEMVPNAVILTAERFRTIQGKLDQLQQLLDRPIAQTPSKLKLRGKIDGNLAHLHATYEFQTITPGEVVNLGGSPAQATAVSLDGKTPRLIASRSSKGRDEGFSVVIDTPGDYTLTLDLVIPVLTRANGQGFTIDLPRTPVTLLEQFDLPNGSRDVRLGGKSLNGSGLTLKGSQLTGSLGHTWDRLELDWKSAQAATAGAVFTADGVVNVRIESPKLMTTTARLTLRVLSGQTKQWRLVVPPQAKVELDDADQSRLDRIDTDPKQPALRTIHLKESSAEPLPVTVTVKDTTGPRPNQKPAAVGPFNVVGAVRQQGSVLVSCLVAEWHIEPTTRGDLTRRAATEEELRADPALAAAFRYGPGDGDRQSGLPWLDLEVENVRGQLKARPAYTLVLMPAVGGGSPHWQVRTNLTVTPRRAGIDRFAVTMPPGCDLDEESIQMPGERVRNFHYDSGRRLLEFRLSPSDAEAVAPVTVTFDGNYPPLEANAQLQATLALPRPKSMFEQEGTVRVTTPTSYELLVPPAEKTAGLELARRSPHELTYRYVRGAPARVEALWRAYRPVMRVDSLIDLTLTADQANVRHQLRLHATPGAPPVPLTLRVPDDIADLRIRKGGQLAVLGNGTASVSFTAADQPVELEYTFALPAPGRPVDAALVLPSGDCEGQSRVRVWSESGLLPVAPRDWTEQNLEEVAGRDRLPVLVLRAPRHQSLTLRTGPQDNTSRVLIERTLVRVQVVASGEQNYRISYRLGGLAGRHLDFELPAPPTAIGLNCTLDGKGIDHEVLAEGAGKVGHRVRLRLASRLVRRSAVLELSYTLTPDRVGRTPLTTELLPPRLLDGASDAPTRWQVAAPADWVILGPEPGASSPMAWGWNGWMWAPRPQVRVADLEAWLAGTDPLEGGAPPSFEAWRAAEHPLRLTHLSRRLWHVGCSLLVAVLGLGLMRLALSSRRSRAASAWVLAALLMMGVLALAVFVPALASQIAYGCQPGLAVLLVMAVVQWLMHERARRQVVLLPSFSPPRAGSSLVRHESTRPHGEPSTVDAPRTAGGSVERG